MMPLAVTMGDPAGIGLELTCRIWRERARVAAPAFGLIADPDAVRECANRCGGDIPVVIIDTMAAAADCFARALPVLPVRLRTPARPGQPDPANAAAIISAIESAVAAVIAGEAGALVTNPIAKSVLLSAGFAHPGHTEFLAALAQRHQPGRRYHPVMMLASETLRVVPLTVHIPVTDVPAAVTRPLILETARILRAALVADFAIPRPRIAVAGLNPHAGESGKIGREELDVIAPALAELRSEGLDIRGPLSADTLFHTEARRSYDAVLAMYHDQALIPIKTIAFDEAVNVTLGLPFVRTSPDHGTAFDIAGRGLASPTSLIAALRLARDMANRRSGHA